jgi:hypothetical protein
VPQQVEVRVGSRAGDLAVRVGAGHLKEIYSTSVSKDPVSRITDADVPDTEAGEPALGVQTGVPHPRIP